MGIKSHAFFFDSYKKYLYEALVHLINKISVHEGIFKLWIKRAVDEMLRICYQLPNSVIFQKDLEMKSIKKSSGLLTNLLKQENWDPENKKLFGREIIGSIIELFENLSLGYHENVNQDDRRVFVPEKHDDQYLSFRLALLFEDVQREGGLDEAVQNGFSLILMIVTNQIQKYPRTLS